MTRIQDAGRYKSLIASEIELREGLATLLVDRAKKISELQERTHIG
jgi:hypothetical protein